MTMKDELTPSQIVGELDEYIIGQDEAKKNVAIAMRNRWRRRHAPEEMRDEIMPNNIIMIGPTGVGKTEIARRLARLARAPFIKVEATKFTEVGYVGRDVESMVRDLVDLAVNIVQEERTDEVEEEAREQAEERVLDALLPGTKSSSQNQVSGPGVVLQDNDGDAQEAAQEEKTSSSGPQVREETRENFRRMLQDGELDEREIEVQVTSDQGQTFQMFGPMGMEEMGMNLQDLLGNLTGGQKKTRRMTVEKALEVLTQEEAEKLIDMDEVQSDAIERVEQSGIVFVDEIDKVAAQTEKRGGDESGVSRQGVQRDLLPIVEGSNITTKYGMVKTDHILFIASGAFHISKPSDLIPELQGRFPIRVELNNLDAEDFHEILTRPKNALLKQYRALLKSEGVEIEFTDEAVWEIARTAERVNQNVENIGARRLHTVLTTLLEDTLYDVPDTIEDDHVKVDAELVEERLSEIASDRDLSQYIL